MTLGTHCSVAEQSNVPLVSGQDEPQSAIQKDPQSSDTGDAVAMNKTTHAGDVAVNVCSQQDSLNEDPLMKILAMLQTNRQEIVDLASVMQAGNEALSTSMREIRKEMAVNQESLKQVKERFNAKLEASIAAANKMTEAVARSMEIKTSELAQEIVEVREEVANVVANVSCELDQLKSKVAEESKDIKTETVNTQLYPASPKFKLQGRDKIIQR
jgi:hypothetical protein